MKYDGPIIRNATKDDPNFDPAKDQVVINMRLGGEMVVERSEVVDKPAPKPAASAPSTASVKGK